MAAANIRASRCDSPGPAIMRLLLLSSQQSQPLLRFPHRSLQPLILPPRRLPVPLLLCPSYLRYSPRPARRSISVRWLSSRMPGARGPDQGIQAGGQSRYVSKNYSFLTCNRTSGGNRPQYQQGPSCRPTADASSAWLKRSEAKSGADRRPVPQVACRLLTGKQIDRET